MDNFIGEWFIDDSICDGLLDFFKNSDYAIENKQVINTTRGKLSQGKKSLDLPLPIQFNHTAIINYYAALKKVCYEYIKKYPYCNVYDRWDIIDAVNIQYYKPGWGYSKFHTERTGCKEPYSTRHLVFMTYLNDVTDGGETEFFHQNLKIKAVKGKTLIWPSDWTYTHRGIVSETQEKYIITGWYNFIDL